MDMTKTKEAYYFSHDSNAQNNERMLMLRIDHGWYGYGLFWAIVESMRDATGYKLTLEAIPSLAFGKQVDTEKFRKFIDDCIIKYHLFESDGECYWSNSLIYRMELKEQKRLQKVEAGRKGGEAKASKNIAPLQPVVSTATPEDSKEKETKVKENKVKVKENKVNENIESNIVKDQLELNEENDAIEDLKKKITQLIFEKEESFRMVKEKVDGIRWPDKEKYNSVVRFIANEVERFEREARMKLDDDLPY